MARKRRKYGDTGIYHIVIRGNNQETLFYDDADRLHFLNRLTKYIKELSVNLYSYCLMGNHVHLLIGNGNKTMSLLVKKICCAYVYYFNKKYSRTGHLFQGRYKSEPIEDTTYFKTVYRYILQNPEKAHICNFQYYKWSSFSKISEGNNVIDNKFTLSIFGNMNTLKLFLHCSNNDICMDFFENHRSDDDLKAAFINHLFNLENPLQISQETINNQLNKLHILKSCGINIKQLSRLTGINQATIRKA